MYNSKQNPPEIIDVCEWLVRPARSHVTYSPGWSRGPRLGYLCKCTGSFGTTRCMYTDSGSSPSRCTSRYSSEWAACIYCWMGPDTAPLPWSPGSCTPPTPPSGSSRPYRCCPRCPLCWPWPRRACLCVRHLGPTSGWTLFDTIV